MTLRDIPLLTLVLMVEYQLQFPHCGSPENCHIRGTSTAHPSLYLTFYFTEK